MHFIIPLYVFSTFCNSLSAQLMSGLRVEIQLESAANSMMDCSSSGGAKSLNYAITGCRLDLESYILTDSVMKVLNQECSSRGLEVISQTTSTTQAQRSTTSITVDISRSCSRALSVIYKERVPQGSASSQIGVGPNSVAAPATALNGSQFDPVASAVISTGDVTGFSNYPVEFQVFFYLFYFYFVSFLTVFLLRLGQVNYTFPRPVSVTR